MRRVPREVRQPRGEELGGGAPLSEVRRLVEAFAVGASVEISYEDRCGNPVWVPGAIVRHDHPAVWVRTSDGREWHVTSGKRIRSRPE